MKNTPISTYFHKAKEEMIKLIDDGFFEYTTADTRSLIITEIAKMLQKETYREHDKK